MRKIDTTKKNIGIASLDELERKKLFNNFLEAGGKILSDKEKNQLSAFDRDAQKNYLKQFEKPGDQEKQTKSSVNQPGKINNKSGISSKQIIVNEKIIRTGRFRQFLQRITIRIKLFVNRITDFSGCFFSLYFLKQFDLYYKQALLSFQLIFTNIFKQNPVIGKKIIDNLDEKNPVFYELLDLLSGINDRTIINEILEHFYNFPDIQQPVNELKNPFTVLFKKIHPLCQYKDEILNAFDKAMFIYSRLDRNRSGSSILNKRKLKNNIYLIFNKLYPKLYWLMCGYEKRIFYSNNDLLNSIPIPAEYIPGRRKKNLKQFSLPNIENTLQANDEISDDDSAIPENIRKGLELMYNSTGINKTAKRSGLDKNLSLNNKLYITSLLLDEFDCEYSFFLITNKVKYNASSKSMGMLDYRNKMINLYNNLEKCNTRLKDYSDLVAVFEKLKQEKPISKTQYIEYSNRLTALEKEKKQASLETRIFVRNCFQNLCDDLKVLIDDMSSNNDIIANPQDLIEFDINIEGNKKLNGKKIYEAISQIYDFASAFVYRLGVNGDLCGEAETTDDKQTIMRPALIKKDVKANGEQQNEENKKSILHELDDLI